MTDFIQIKDAIQMKKGNIVGKVIKVGDLKAGSKDGRDWTNKKFTLEDISGTVELTAWNEDIQKIEVGKTYKFDNPWWKEYQGNMSLELGKYCKVEEVTGTEDVPLAKVEQQSKLTGPIGTPSLPVRDATQKGADARIMLETLWPMAKQMAFNEIQPISEAKKASEKLTTEERQLTKEAYILSQCLYKGLVEEWIR